MIRSDQYTVGTAPSLLAQVSPVTASPAGWFYLTVGTATSVYLGGPNVTSSNGAQVAASATLSGYLFSGDHLYACTTSGSVTAGVLQSGS